MFTGDQARVAHELPRSGEAPQRTELADDRGGRDLFDPAQGRERADQGLLRRGERDEGGLDRALELSLFTSMIHYFSQA